MSVIGLTGGFLGSKAMGAGQLAPAHLQDDTGETDVEQATIKIFV